MPNRIEAPSLAREGGSPEVRRRDGRVFTESRPVRPATAALNLMRTLDREGWGVNGAEYTQDLPRTSYSTKDRTFMTGYPGNVF